MTTFPKAIAALALTAISLFSGASARAAAKEEYILAVSIYVGWMPYYYMNQTGILKKWADKYGIGIKVLPMDYGATLDAFTAQKADAVVITNMEALDMPAKSGVDTTIIVVGDYSNGNDKVITRGIPDVAGLKGQTASLVEATVSQYLLERCLEAHGLKGSDVKLLNVSDSDIGPAFIANPSQKVVVTWNPMAMEILQQRGTQSVCDSSQFPGEIQDLLAVNTGALKKNPHLGDALVGAWYEVMATMSRRGPEADAAMSAMAELAGTDLAAFQAQLRTTAMFYTPESALDYATGPEIKAKNDFVREFCFKHGLLGENAKSKDTVGIQYPDGTVQGDPNNVKLRYDGTYMVKAKNGTL